MSKDTAQETHDIRELPEGFVLKSAPTAAGGHGYTVEVPQAESLQAILDAYAALGKNGEEVVLALWNSGNEQGAKQGQKEAVRKAVNDEDGDVDAAVAKHQESARGFMQGAPRGGGGARHASGMTKKQRDALGTAVATEYATSGPPSTKRMNEICAELGINPELLGK